MFQIWEKSGNFIFSQGNLEKMKKVMEKSGNFKKIASFHKLRAILEKECFLT